METSRSVFMDIRFRELNGFRKKKRPFFADSELTYKQTGGVAVENNGIPTSPFAVSFCKSSQNSKIFAVSDEDGHVNLFNSAKFCSSGCVRNNPKSTKIRGWVAHNDAVFDISWIKGDNSIMTASGDQTIKLWDVEKIKCTRVLRGHTGIVKSICSHPTNSDLLVSGSGDGSLALWDLRSQSSSHRDELCINFTSRVERAHLLPLSKQNRSRRPASSSITSVLYLKDEITIATAGASDSTLQFWDTRKLKVPFTQASPHPDPTNPRKRNQMV